jgi:hypothetical protein
LAFTRTTSPLKMPKALAEWQWLDTMCLMGLNTGVVVCCMGLGLLVMLPTIAYQAALGLLSLGSMLATGAFILLWLLPKQIKQPGFVYRPDNTYPLPDGGTIGQFANRLHRF